VNRPTRSDDGRAERKKSMKNNMKLTDFAYRMNEDTMVWIAENPTSDEGLYFGTIGEMRFHFAKNYEVVEFYAEHYDAAYCCGITIIVKKIEQ
jgi:hypothetical protein